MIEPFLFFTFALFALIGGLGTLVSRSPVVSALWMVVTMFAVACLYLTLQAPFVAVIQVLVYAGAIMVLFLFVIMLLNLENARVIGKISAARIAAFVAGVAVLAQILVVVSLKSGLLPEMAADAVVVEGASAENLGVLIFTEYAFLLQVVGILLLAATIGAVMLAKKRFS